MPSRKMLSLYVTPLDLVVLAASWGRGGKITDQAKWYLLWPFVLLPYSKLWSFIGRWDVAEDMVGSTKPWYFLPGEVSASSRRHEEPRRYLNEVKKV